MHVCKSVENVIHGHAFLYFQPEKFQVGENLLCSKTAVSGENILKLSGFGQLSPAMRKHAQTLTAAGGMEGAMFGVFRCIFVLTFAECASVLLKLEIAEG